MKTSANAIVDVMSIFRFLFKVNISFFTSNVTSMFTFLVRCLKKKPHF